MSLLVTPKRKLAAGPLPGASIQVLGMEVTQAVQNLAHDVPLIRGKATLVRVYLNPQGFDKKLQVRGEIAVAPAPGSPAKYVASLNTVAIGDGGRPDLPYQRRDLKHSLNFLLPTEAINWPAIAIELKRISALGGDIPIAAAAPVTLPFETAPPLRIRVIGIRYFWLRPDGLGVYVAPEAYHFDFLRSFLARAYPICSLEWSQFVVQAHPQFMPPFGMPQPDGSDQLWLYKLNLVHNQLAAIRAKDVDSGVDPRTHYYGLVSDASAGLFLRGASKDIPRAPDPTVVSAGPAGDPRLYPLLNWDRDRSFADWYGAHEIAHTFGRFHPGFCGQDASDPHFPYPEGRIGDVAQGDMLGFDIGDATLNLPMQIMPNETCHDIMTYCGNQWISAYSYEAILTRLREEDRLFAPVA